MKNAKLFLITTFVLFASCEDFGNLIQPPSPGYLCWSIKTDPATKALPDLPDTNEFILTVKNAAGKVLYHGSYGDSPAKMEVQPGSYTVSAISGEFSQPAFAMPQYGDEQVVVVPEGKSVTAHLECTLLNCGVTLKISPEFLTSYPDGVLFLKQGSTRLMHAYTEKRIAYFFPGEIQLLLHSDSKDMTLLTRSLSAREVLAIKIAVAGQSHSSGSVNIAVDTTKNWLSQTYTIGGNNGDGSAGADTSSALTVSDAINHIGEDVWMYGYIVGGDLTANGKSIKTDGITKPSHLAMAARSSVTEKASCVAVELPSGKVRDALNLVDHPELIGTRVYVKGKLTDAYFGTIGLKGTSDYAK
ncbi:MAG: DUF4493 domain-containing protein [Bacteroidales bacterium]|nr:DUF4493 domain-containing protein [Bacteroidales bacterium]